MFESEAKDSDILKEISKGVKLKHVRTNDRSKPNLKGEIEQSLLRVAFTPIYLRRKSTKD